jgi:hypothetical protein
LMSKLTPAKRRAAGRRGNQSQRNNAEIRRYGDTVPF